MFQIKVEIVCSRLKVVKMKTNSSRVIVSVRNLFTRCCGKNLRKNDNPNRKVDLKLNYLETPKQRFIKMKREFEEGEGAFYSLPDTAPKEQKEALLQLRTPKEKRDYYYQFIKKIEHYQKKKLYSEANLKYKIDRNPEHLEYGCNKNSLFVSTPKSALLKPCYNNLRDAVMFGQKLVIDLGFEDRMDTQEIRSCIKQISYSYDANMCNKEPFHLHFCNANMDMALVKGLQEWVIDLKKPHRLVTLTEKSYLDLFPKNKLVYLTPHCNEYLKKYNHDDVYIIGGIVDENRQGPVSLEKAKSENIRVAKLPLYILSKIRKEENLSLDLMMKILLTMKETLNWKEAFKHIPRTFKKYTVTMPANYYNQKLSEKEEK